MAFASWPGTVSRRSQKPCPPRITLVQLRAGPGVEGHFHEFFAHLKIGIEKPGFDGEVSCVYDIVANCLREFEVKLRI